MSLYRTLATSNHFLPRTLRRIRRGIYEFSIPAPKLIFKPLLWIVLAFRELWAFFYRVFVCEPLFKAYCKQYGKNLHTSVFLPYIYGKGNFLLGDNVIIAGKSSFMFAARLSEATPVIVIGDNTGMGHDCSFVIGSRITIGKNCRIANGVRMFDSPGHPLNVERRRAGAPPDPGDVRPITIGDDVWIGVDAVIFPGVTIGNNCIISTMAVVINDVPPNTMVAGNPARKMLALEPPKA